MQFEVKPLAVVTIDLGALFGPRMEQFLFASFYSSLLGQLHEIDALPLATGGDDQKLLIWLVYEDQAIAAEVQQAFEKAKRDFEREHERARLSRSVWERYRKAPWN